MFHVEIGDALNNHALYLPHRVFASLFIYVLLTLFPAEATEMATEVVATAAVVVVTEVAVSEEVLAATVWALSALASRTKNGVCDNTSLFSSHLLTFFRYQQPSQVREVFLQGAPRR